MSKASNNIMFAATDSYKEIEDKSNMMWKREMEFKNLAKNTIKTSSKYLACNSDLSAVEVSVSDSFASLLGEISEEVDVSHIGNIMKSIGKLRAKMVNQVMNDFFNPLKEFIEFKFGFAQYLKSQVKKSVREYQSHLDQFEKGNIIKDGKVAGGKFAQLEKELQQVKETINSNATQFGNVVKDLEQKKSLIVLRQIIKCMEVHQSFYNNVIVLFDELMPKLEQLLQKLEETEQTKISKEGYLLAKRGKNNWNKEFFELRDEKLYNYKIEKGLRYSGLAPEKTLELNLCSIKPGCPDKLKDRLKEDSKRCFQIFTPQKKPLVLIAPSKSETKEWVDSLLSAISLSLDNSNTGSTSGNLEPPKNTKVLKLLRSVPGNHNCVDCDAEDPVWASINLGVLICVECSGVHRYLGVHITKVRSLTLDHWDPEQLIYMMRVGNEKANHFLECRIPDGYEKPTASSSRADREKYITAKYKEKLFVPPLTANFNINSVLYEMVSTESEGDVMKMIMLLFYGGDVNHKENGKSLLSQSVSKDNWLYAQTLCLFGVDLFQSDEIGWTPFHHAAYANSFHSLLVLLRNGKEKDILTLRDHLHQNPIDIANHYNYKESQTLLNGNLSWTMSIDELLEVVENESHDISIQFPILVNCPSNDPPSPSVNIIPSNDPSSPRNFSQREFSLLESSNENNDETSSHIVKTAWKRGVDEKTKETTEKRSNRISVLMSSITKEGSRKNSSETVKEGGSSASSLSNSLGKDGLREKEKEGKEKEKGDSKIINLIARKGKRSTIGAFTRSSPNGKGSEPNLNINNNNNNSISNLPSPRFRKVPPSIEILESFPNFEKSYLNNLSASLHGENNNNNNNNNNHKEEEEGLDESDTTDDEYDEEYMEFNPPDFEPPLPPDLSRKNDYTAEDIENALNED